MQPKEVPEKYQRAWKGKFDNRFTASYPKTTYLRARKVAQKMGVSMQDLQRSAMEMYLNEMEKKLD
jgi:hypothetical protein